jgi:neutral ceramidase
MLFVLRSAAALVVLLLLAPEVVAQSWQAGAASVVITPPQPMPMAGYASRGAKHAEGKLTDLYAKALALQDGEGHRAVLVTLDAIGLDRGLSVAICESLQNEFGLARSEIVLASSHTHSGPVVARNLRPMHYLLFEESDRQLVDAYATFLQIQIRAAVAGALASLAPAEVLKDEGEATFAVNRRNNKEADVPQLREAGMLKGPFDHAVPVLAVKRDGKLIAVAFGYACHCTVLSGFEWSGDYAGHAQLDVEAKHPGCVALFWAGCGGDQNPIPRRQTELAEEYGRQLADSVEAVLAGELKPVGGKLGTSYAEIDLQFGALPTREALAADAESTNVHVAARAKSLLVQLDAGDPLPTTYPYPVTQWRLGDDVEWLFLGGEVVVDYALRIKAELADAARPDRSTWVAGYCQDVMAYIPSRRVLLEGGYEGASAMIYYGRPTVWSEDVEEQIMAAIHRQAGTP